MKKVVKISSLICGALLVALGFSACRTLKHSSKQKEPKEDTIPIMVKYGVVSPY